MKTVVRNNRTFNKALRLLTAVLLFAGAAGAQTFTTRAAGNWSNAATWVGGIAPGRTIAAGATVNIKHKVTADLSGDLVINGTLNITADTLSFASSYGSKTIVASTGTLYIKTAAYSQDLAQNKCNLEINGGRLVVEGATLVVSKDFLAAAGSRRKYLNATVQVGGKYEAIGTSASRVNDTVQNSTLQVSQISSGDYLVKDYTTLRTANAKITVGNGNFVNETNATIVMLAGATGNYGFNLLRTSKDLENKGAWDARIDQHCVGGVIKGGNMAAIDLTRTEDCSTPNAGASAAAPELVFSSPTLVSGQANKQGAVYRFANITSGIDAELKLVKFSRPDILMRTVDNNTLGWNKAFQPEFGLNGLVSPNQNWYIDFEMVFYKTGTTTKQKLAKIDMTALDVDGDGVSVREYAVFDNPSQIIYSTVSYLTNQTAGLTGQSFTCPIDGILSLLTPCLACGGDGKAGIWNIDECTACDGSGMKYLLCNHSFDDINGNTVQGPVENFTNIDTLSTQVMATYQYVDKDRIKFRYGAKSGTQYSNGAGVRLNSLWFRQFSMTPQQILPVKLSSFAAIQDKKNVILTWTGQEENFSHYVLQRSTDGRNFSDVAIIFTAGNGNAQAYKYRDPNVSAPANMVFYRLQMVDLTKEWKYSEVKTVRLGEQSDDLKLAAFPNPVSSSVQVTLPKSFQGQPAVVEVFTSGGLRVQQKAYTNVGQTETLSFQSLNRGVYLIKASCNGQSVQQQVVKN